MTTREIQDLDKRFVWHPFTRMADWCAAEHEPLVLVRGDRARLWDSEGREFIDGNASIWTNVHGHNHPAINAAIRDQLDRIAHASFLGFTNEPAARLAHALVSLFPERTLERVFYTDDGSTAVECALKIATQFWQIQGRPDRCEFIAFDQAYHGDTLGAAALGGIPLFHRRFAHLGLLVHHLRDAAALEALPPDTAQKIAGVVIEPLVQGAAGMRLWPAGLLGELRAWCDRHGVLLIFDEVMTGFGRTGKLFAFEHENAHPDLLCLAKGLTGGYLPLGATLVTARIFTAFLGPPDELTTFFHGHSYAGNPLGCAAALASLEVFHNERVLDRLPGKIARLEALLGNLRAARPRHVGPVRQCGLIAGIDLMKDAAAGVSFDRHERVGERVCLAAREFGLLTRPIGETIVLMPPLCISPEEIERAVDAIRQAIVAVLGP